MPTRYQFGAAGSHGIGIPARNQDGAAGSHGLGTPDRTCIRGIRWGCRISRVREARSSMPTVYQDGAAGSHGFGPTDPTCLQAIRTGLQDRTYLRGIRTIWQSVQDLTGSEHQIAHAYKVTGRDCRISRVRNIRVEHAYKVSGWGCMNSRVRNTRSYMPTRYQDRAAGSRGFGTTDTTCLRGIRTWLQDLTGSEHQIVDRTSQQAIRVGLHDPMGKEQQFQHAYEVSRRGCRISQVRNIRSNITTRYQVGAAGSHGLETTDRTKYQDGAAGSHGFGPTDPTCLQAIRTGLQDRTYLRGIRTIWQSLQDLTGLEHQIVHA